MNNFNPAIEHIEFIHIPKCGGTSFHTLLHEILDGHYEIQKPGSNWTENIQSIYGFGGHRQLGDNPLRKARRHSRPIVVSMFRDPYDRFLSHYKHVQESRVHPLSARQDLKQASPMRFAEILYRENHVSISNMQTRYLLGHDNPEGDIRAIVREALSRVDFFAPVELSDWLANVLGIFVGQQNPSTLMRSNVSKLRLKSSDIDHELREFIYRINQIDVQLYCLSRLVASIVASSHSDKSDYRKALRHEVESL